MRCAAQRRRAARASRKRFLHEAERIDPLKRMSIGHHPFEATEPPRLLQWAADEGLQMALSQPGKPWQNGTDESFNGKFRDECLSIEYFRNRTEARVLVEQWRRHYNAVRPRSALGYLTPAQFVESLSGKDHQATSLK
jgi:IS30 family transposase